MADQLTEEQLAECKEVFRELDRDCSGYIDKANLRATMESLGQHPTEQDLEDMLNEADKDGDGVIDFTEFTNLTVKKFKEHHADNNKMIRQAFMGFDEDGDGVIDLDELKNALLHLGEQFEEEEIINLFHKADSNGDGHIDFEEFLGLTSAL
ncbi:calmodulin mutant SYNCAM71A [Basidiobolus meristosporus CBS 931.73]|uniref:Calmodulin mutant SYNCAM71A n=1 Tax=Basidiobolus meristosporus CBS 931.73 TaxID=1314790 RepID=A0A1Y1XR87_9FUNG|nr:calmodulin mutant SYNCAM71A [Basidiobolus meristosporus CBS 931.73]|eukprot:ORX88165.1 calmodulin mutant SYNCAM71A [Basidiobolus meristosporus CBS 931.73]